MNDTKSVRRKNAMLQTLADIATRDIYACHKRHQSDSFVSCQYDNLMREAVVAGTRSNPQFF